ncbi:MAG: hypothetical protein IKJ39_08500 [Lachnospiraceae bacterium]|nr:hypothetical protein [Lachnospiraceae bacterium]
MKKKLAILLLTVLVVISLTACGSESFTCDLCGEEKTGTKYTSTQDEDVVYCKECIDMVQDLMNNLQ